MGITAHPARLRVGSPDYLIAATVGVLVVIGILAVYSSSFALGILEFGDANYFVVRQVFFGALGAVAMFMLMKTDYRHLRVISPLLMLAAIIALVAVLVPGIGMHRNGAARWIGVGGPIPPLQPSEFAKLALIIYKASRCSGSGSSPASCSPASSPGSSCWSRTWARRSSSC